MTIHQLSKMVHMKTEVIRSYRIKGLIHPRQNPDNKYYEYSLRDFLELLYIRRLRASTVSLNSIGRMYHSDEFSELQSEYQKEIARLEQEIDNLKQQKENLQIIADHLGEYQMNQAGVSVSVSSNEKIDCYDICPGEDPAFDEWMEHSEIFTQTIHISKEMMTSDGDHTEIPIRIGIGSYRTLIEEKGLPMPEKVVICPPGIYLTHSITLDNLETISHRQLKPLLMYAKEHHYRFDSDSTAFLVRIDKTSDCTKYIFRLRVKVVPQQGF